MGAALAAKSVLVRLALPSTREPRSGLDRAREARKERPMEDDEHDEQFVCDGCGMVFNNDERAEEGEPYCLLCWEAMEA